eukprot:TRINITY_DN8733_c0_g1::TRINITY_DN8733_c0_g1_i1::g.23961::m.23961 TRINITY_DN8733_c0_g1::TRINITY_DN8733_c0_g1_i1::g.23961  ORF type:complete len:378 (+),score=50.75,sp/Q9LHN4/LPAT5_ARATH/32.69/2e-63,Acyltransferase/PF01553.16/7.3e-18 TRINITY_DN8733_c0_g1_i1:42-1136(+)
MTSGEKSADKPAGQAKKPIPMSTKFRGYCVILLLLFLALGGMVFCILPSYIFRPLNLSLHRRYVAFWFSAYWAVTVWWFESLNQIKFVYTGDQARDDDSVLIVANHPSEFDMPFFWPLALHHGRLGNLKFVTKAAVKRAPGLGWGISMCEFLFLQRKWESDREHIKNHLSRFAKHGDPLWLIIFPEGTDFAERKLPQSQEYQRSNNLPVLTNVLQPRSKGLYACMNALRDSRSMTAIYNYTWAYKNKPRNIFDILYAKEPTEVHINLKRVLPQDIGFSEESVSKWLNTIYFEKDRQLGHFKEKGCFDAPKVPVPPCTSTVSLYAYLTMWAILSVVYIYLLCNFSIARIYILLACLFLQAWVQFF